MEGKTLSNNEPLVYYIYGHKNKINGKWYIGQTCQQPNRRWRCGDGYKPSGNNKGCCKFYRAIKKYGWENFEHFILEETTVEYIDKLEVEYIKKYNSVNNGYNLTYGGWAFHKASRELKNKLSKSRIGANNGFYGKKHSIESREKMSKSQKEYYKNIENREKLSKAHKGKTLSKETRDKISLACRGINSKKVICVETQKIYNSITEAGKSVGIKKGSHIFDCCIGKRHSCGGYHWNYYVPSEEM